MSIQSKKSTSWFARLGTVLGRSVSGQKRRSASSGQNRRGLRFESLETRSLLSATVLPTISGIVYQNLAGGSLASNNSPLPNITVNLFRDGGDGLFEGRNPGSDDTLVGTSTSGANGAYTFANIPSAGTYFVQESGVSGLVPASGQSVQTVVITSSDLQGATGTTIDSFASTSQYVSGSLHGGKTGTSSQSTSDAIGGHRNLYVQLTTAGGSVSLGANSDWPGALDFASGAASSGMFWVNWDGNNGNAAVLNPTGLGQTDITSQGASTGIELNVAGDHDMGVVALKVFSDANDWSWATVSITNTTDGSLDSSGGQFVAFSSFTVGGGMGANFSQVGAIQLSIYGANANDGLVGPVVAIGPMVFSENFVNVAQADMSVVKSAAPNPVVAGSQLTYSFTTTNNGPSADTGVTLSDTLPAGVQYVSSSGQGTVTNNNGTLTVQLGSMASGAVATTSIVVTVNPGATGSITNTVTVTGNDPDPNLSNNTSTVTTQINQSVDLALVKTASPNPVKAGNQLTYTLTATNNGPSNATGVTIVDTLPAGTSYISASGESSETTAGQTLTLNVGNMAAGASSTITVVVGVASTATGTITNTAVVSGNQPDPNLANNTASVTTQINVPVVQQSAPGLTIVKWASPSPSVVSGGALTYSLSVTNGSLNTLTGVTVADMMPAGFRYFFEISHYSLTVSGNTFSFGLGALAPNATDTITFEGVVTEAAGSTITNWATVSDNQGDTNTSNKVVTTVLGTPGSKYYLLGR